ncbi:MAG: hypothetical protein C3F13_17155 [Anaerolineales bacterium]|nr:MAG: hypothetical protein C3F13_17155 [Anaerolineales bacterium]
MQTVLLYGNSLTVSTIGASLQACPDLQVLSLDPTRPNVIWRQEELQPGIVIFDLATAYPNFAIDLWRAHPGMLLIGVDPSSDEMLVLSDRPQPALSVQDLVNVIRDHSQSDPGD